MTARALIGAALAAGLACHTARADIVLRTGEIIPGDPVELTLDGVLLDDHRPLRIDEVRSVRGDRGADWLAIAHHADHLWRARTRLQRDDAALGCRALREFDAVFAEPDRVARAHAAASDTARLVAEGLLLCALAEGDDVAGVRAWTRWRSAAAAHDRRVRLFFPPNPVVDAATGLAPRLMPLALSEAARDALAAGTPSAGLPLAAATAETRTLIDAVAAATADDTAARARARSALARIINTEPGTWREAWARTARGLSALEDATGFDHVDAALLDLAHVPARFERTLPELAAACRARIAVVLARRGEHEAAGAVAAPLAGAPHARVARAWLDAMMHQPPAQSPTQRPTDSQQEPAP